MKRFVLILISMIFCFFAANGVNAFETVISGSVIGSMNYFSKGQMFTKIGRYKANDISLFSSRGITLFASNSGLGWENIEIGHTGMNLTLSSMNVESLSRPNLFLRQRSSIDLHANDLILSTGFNKGFGFIQVSGDGSITMRMKHEICTPKLKARDNKRLHAFGMFDLEMSMTMPSLINGNAETEGNEDFLFFDMKPVSYIGHPWEYISLW